MLKIVRVDSLEFEEELIKLNHVHVFNRPQFAMLNNLWVDEVHFLLVKSSKVELAITFGERNGVLLSPWSAPFGGFGVAREDMSIARINQSLKLLMDYGRLCNCVELKISLPPSFYSQLFLTKLMFCCSGIATKVMSDINFAFDLNNPIPKDRFNRNYWRNFNKGKQNELSLVLCETMSQKEQCYAVIEENRTTLGYSLKMGFEPFLKTSKIIDIDFFLLNNSKENFAAAICYWVAPKIVQIIYWGDYTFKRGEGAMHQLASQLQMHYKTLNVCILDVGTSSTNAIPNIGLCDFKESLGCDVSLKNSYVFNIKEIV